LEHLATFVLRQVVKRYGAGDMAPGLGPIDLDVPAGATTCLIGPSGCGKSTLLRVLLGLVVPDAGSVVFAGAPVDAAARLRMGYVIQDGGLFPHMTAAENVTLMARWLGWAPARSAARLDELVGLTRFPADALGRYPAELSGGQRQRVGLMRALMLDPEVLLLDEPLGALDPLVRADLQAELGGLFRALGKTVVLVTHDLAEAGLLGDRVILLRDGTIAQAGRLRELIEAPADPFVTRFVRAQRGPLEVLA
jgi:osmoprotectant transport system ATP-binding protein